MVQGIHVPHIISKEWSLQLQPGILTLYMADVGVVWVWLIINYPKCHAVTVDFCYGHWQV